MPTIVMTPTKDDLDASVKKKAYAFLEKLREDDTRSGLNVEPIQNCVDSRVRTGRVDQKYRAVMFRLDSQGEPTYVIHGIWMHDDAIARAQRARLTLNPVNGVPAVEEVLQDVAAAAAAEPEPATLPASVQRYIDLREPAAEPVVLPPGITAQTLTSELGLDPEVSLRAVAAQTSEAFTAAVDAAETWQGLALIQLSEGHSVQDVKETFGLAPVDMGISEDEAITRAIQKQPAAQTSFAWVEGSDELRRIIEEGDFGRWRLYLHPEQRQFVSRTYRGPARVSGGAGTGKTVVVMHRARQLAKANPSARVLVTTFTRNLAESLRTDLRRLDESVPAVTEFDQPGIWVSGVDALVNAVLYRLGDLSAAAGAVLGIARAELPNHEPDRAWDEAIAAQGADLPPELRKKAFFQSEYGLVVLPNRITTESAYLRIPRPGRGVSLDRSKRAAVWRVIQDYRTNARLAEAASYPERAAIAAAALEQQRAATGRSLFDHVLVDEAQDLSPVHLQFLRALVAPGDNDLFIAEDSHQRIYGDKITLSRYGIRITGRARRLTLNYRTTATNLSFAMRVLSGGEYSDLEGQAEQHRYRSLRPGDAPQFVQATSMADAFKRTATLLRRWKAEVERAKGSLETIGILVRNSSRRTDVVNGLREHGVEVRSVDRESVRRGQPVVMTMHRAKGLEFTHVLLFDVGERSIPRNLLDHAASDADRDDALLRERSLVYVAATRARDQLALVWTGDLSPLLTEAVLGIDAARTSTSEKPVS